MRKVVALLVALFVTEAITSAQERGQASYENCAGPIYKFNQVSKRATLGSRSTPSLTAEALANQVSGKIVLNGVLCRSGLVTDIKVIEGLPFGMTERAIEAARELKFTPAEKDGKPVSVAIKFEFNFGYIGERRPLAKGPLEGRIIESVEVAGYPEAQREDLWLAMEPLNGELYNKEKLERVWLTLLESGNFDKENSTLRIEDGTRGGIAIVIELKKKSGP